MEQMSMQKRLLLAALLSIVFFIVYDFFMPKRAPLEQNQTTITQTMDQSKAPASTNDTPKSNENLASNEIIATIKGQSYEAKIDKLGRIAKFYLTEDKYKTEDGNKIELVSQNPLPLELRFNDSTLNTDAFKVAYSSDTSEVDASSEPKTIKLTQNLNGVTVTKNIKFYPNGRYEVEVNLSKSVDYFITPGFRPNIAIDSYTVHGVMLRNTDDSLNIIEDGDAKEVKNYANTTIAAASDRYYTVLFYSFNKPFEAVLDKDANNNPIVFVKANDSLKLGAYIGPKEHKI